MPTLSALVTCRPSVSVRVKSPLPVVKPSSSPMALLAVSVVAPVDDPQEIIRSDDAGAVLAYGAGPR